MSQRPIHFLGWGPIWERSRVAEELAIARQREHRPKFRVSALDHRPQKLPDVPASVKDRNTSVPARTDSPHRKGGEPSPRARGRVCGEVFRRMPGRVLAELLRKQNAMNEENVRAFGGGAAALLSAEEGVGGDEDPALAVWEARERARRRPAGRPTGAAAPTQGGRARSLSPKHQKINSAPRHQSLSSLLRSPGAGDVKAEASDKSFQGSSCQEPVTISHGEWLQQEEEVEHRRQTDLPLVSQDHRPSMIHLGWDAAHSVLLSQRLVVVDGRSHDARTKAHLRGSRHAPNLATGRYPEFLQILKKAQACRASEKKSHPLLVLVHDADSVGASLASQLAEQGFQNVHFTMFAEVSHHAAPDLVVRAPVLERWERGWE